MKAPATTAPARYADERRAALVESNRNADTTDAGFDLFVASGHRRLVEAFVLAAIRRGHGVALQRVRRGIAFVQRELHVERPLIHAAFKTDGVDLFVDQWGKLVNASKDGQVAMRGALESSLQRVEWDQRGLAVRLFPLVRTADDEQPRSIVINCPERGFERPTLAGKGIRVDVIVERYRAGESSRELARDYRVPVDLIDDAVRCELRAAS